MIKLKKKMFRRKINASPYSGYHYSFINECQMMNQYLYCGIIYEEYIDGRWIAADIEFVKADMRQFIDNVVPKLHCMSKNTDFEALSFMFNHLYGMRIDVL